MRQLTIEVDEEYEKYVHPVTAKNENKKTTLRDHTITRSHICRYGILDR